ncbi:MAG TPA: response regulator transcription factor [Candidatus Cybelea sp.]|nr:response regulator transcription factor [Candidatus Cybelea sp.]
MRLMIADDHVLVADMLEGHLAKLGPDVQIDKAADLASVLVKADTGTKYELIILDLRMPGMNGLAGVKAVQRRFPEARIAVISGEATPENAEDALAAGAAGFIPKTIGGRAMLNAVRLILSGERYMPAEFGHAQGADRKAGGSQTSAMRVLATLTQRERQVLRQLVAGDTNADIGKQLGIETVTVALHLRSIYRKLDVESRTQAVKFCIESGQDI